MPFVRFVFAKYNKEQEEKAWRVYMADSIQLLGEGMHITKKYSELIEESKEEKPRNEYEDMTGEEISNNIIKKFGLKER